MGMYPTGLGSGTFDTTAAYSSPLTLGLGTGTAGMGMGAAGTTPPMFTDPGTAAASGMSPLQMMAVQKALSGAGQPVQGIPAPQLGAAQQQVQPGSFSAGPSVPTVNPALRQQMAQMLMGGQ